MMTIQEALEIVITLAKKEQLASRGNFLKGMRVIESEIEAIAIAEIMLTEEAFFTSYQEQTVEIELQIQEEERER